ncbi:hypothetical protein OUZ56_003434 [Daphnia magna]|uniref:Uncharacterized protein n=1 Tax=Daphnia magna TaxID=35525 RepID=A0ABR0A941_9CRUS|nr:hypothetical protein OUZ56_003434 [Daphnia magna]
MFSTLTFGKTHPGKTKIFTRHSGRADLDPLLLALAPQQDEPTVGGPRDYPASDTRTTGIPTVETGTGFRSTIQKDNALHFTLLLIGVEGVRPLSGVLRVAGASSMMGLFVTGSDCSTTGANRPLSIPAASSSMTLVTFTGIICRKLACKTHSSEVAKHNRGIFMTPAAGRTCGRPISPIVFPGY